MIEGVLVVGDEIRCASIPIASYMEAHGHEVIRVERDRIPIVCWVFRATNMAVEQVARWSGSPECVFFGRYMLRKRSLRTSRPARMTER